ncbi:MAG: DUF2924 domain-containing protein [Planctomycetota bacterium]
MEIDIAALPSMTPKQLTALWQQLAVRGDPPHFKQALLRGISWHVQTRTHGGLEADTRRLLKAAIRHAPDPQQAKKRRTRRDEVTLRSGTTLIRTWRGRKHEVVVLDDGKRFSYRDTEYASLSEIAREITGARWSGPRFFGLKKLKGSA